MQPSGGLASRRADGCPAQSLGQINSLMLVLIDSSCFSRLLLRLSSRVRTVWLSNFDQFFVGLSITVFELDGGRETAPPWTFSGKLTRRKCLAA